MNAAALAYKTSSPAALKWWDEITEKVASEQERRRAYTDQLLANFGPVGLRYQYDQDEINDRPLMRNRLNDITGVLCRDGEQPPKGSGWRLDASTGFWKPDLRSNAGKARQEEIDALSGTDILGEAHVIGAPGEVFSANFSMIYRMSMHLREDTRELYVTWPSKECADGMAKAAVEGVTWTEVPLSEWYGWQEQHEKAAA